VYYVTALCVVRLQRDESDVSALTVKGAFKVFGAEGFQISHYKLVCMILSLWCTPGGGVVYVIRPRLSAAQ
jgi:hypothetical protein